MPDSPYLFLELALFVYLLGFGWEELRLKDIGLYTFVLPALSLALLWLVIDQIALALGLWRFPRGGTLDFRLLALPIEEYILFFFHSLVCLVFLKHYAKVK